MFVIAKTPMTTPLPAREHPEMFAWVSWFRLFGTFLLSGVALDAFLLYVHYDPPLSGAWEVADKAVRYAAMLGTGFGLLCHRRWAAVVFAVLMVCLNLWMLVELLRSSATMPWELFLMGAPTIAAMGLFPAFITWHQWERLR